jgi:hypothetical protein
VSLLDRLPVDRGDLMAVASLTPGVLPIAATDSTAAGFSVAGQPSSQNRVTVDGASILFAALPREAVRATRVVTNTYDVSRGQFTGGQVVATTRSGTSMHNGSASLLAQPGAAASPRTASLSAGAGGPLAGSSSFYYVAADGSRSAGVSGSILDRPDAIAQLGASPDSVARFSKIVSGLGLGAAAAGPVDPTASSGSGVTRVDWDVSNAASLMVRADLRFERREAVGVSALAPPRSGGAARDRGAGLQASLTSSGSAFTNELRVYAAANHRDATPYLHLPQGIVTLQSDASASHTVSALRFGGNAAFPSDVSQRSLEFTDEASALVGQAHRLKIGASLNHTVSRTASAPNALGTFVFGSLDDVLSGTPLVFSRSLHESSTSASTSTASAWAGDAWRPLENLQVLFGARGDATRVGLGPSSGSVSPRFGFSYSMGSTAGVPSTNVKGGFGEFRGIVPLTLLEAVQRGASAGAGSLMCIGPAAPAPDWPAYAQSPDNIPIDCAASAASYVEAAPSTARFGPHYAPPRTWRGSLTFSQRVGQRYGVNLEGSYARSRSMTAVADANLGLRQFELGGESGRPVYAPLSSIAPATGQGGVPMRNDPTFGPVLAVSSTAGLEAVQLSSTFLGPGIRNGLTSLTYSWSRVRDQVGGRSSGMSLPSTAGDPALLEWGPSDMDRRHQLLAVAYVPLAKGFDVSVIARSQSGAPYTPMVSGDVNADGLVNDRAFVPRTEDTALGAAMTRLLSGTDDRARSCLLALAGTIAPRGGCRTGWTTQLDAQASWGPRPRILDNRLTVTIGAINVLSAVPERIDRTLLMVTGFDPAARLYSYRVNEHFGSRHAPRALLPGIQVSLRAEVAIGGTAGRQQLRQLSQAAPSPNVLKEQILRTVPFPVATLLKQADSLGLSLTADQRVRLGALAKSYAQRMDSIGLGLAHLLIDAGPNPDGSVVGPRVQSANFAILQALQQSLREAHAILTNAQWDKLPASIRLPLQGPPGE